MDNRAFHKSREAARGRLAPCGRSSWKRNRFAFKRTDLAGGTKIAQISAFENRIAESSRTQEGKTATCRAKRLECAVSRRFLILQPLICVRYPRKKRRETAHSKRFARFVRLRNLSDIGAGALRSGRALT